MTDSYENPMRDISDTSDSAVPAPNDMNGKTPKRNAVPEHIEPSA